MLYFIKKDLPTSEGIKSTNVVVGAILSNGVDQSKTISAEEVINSYTAFNAIRSSFLVSIAVPNNWDKPIITIGNGNNQAMDVSQIYSLLVKWSEQLDGKSRLLVMMNYL